MNGNESLQAFVRAFADREVPRVGWPTLLAPARGTQVVAFERAAVLTVIVSRDDVEAAAQMDLVSREVYVTAFDPDDALKQELRLLALNFMTDRTHYDRTCGLYTASDAPYFDEEDPDTFTEMQMRAEVTGSDWYPPAPMNRRAEDWAMFLSTARRFNDRPLLPALPVATGPCSSRPLGEPPSAGQATPDLRAPAAKSHARFQHRQQLPEGSAPPSPHED